MNWAEVSVLFGIFALIAWVSWLRHRASVKAMEHGYEQKRTGDVLSYEDDTCQIWNAPKGWTPPPMWNSRIPPPMWDSRIRRGEKPTPKESGELPQPGDNAP